MNYNWLIVFLNYLYLRNYDNVKINEILEGQFFTLFIVWCDFAFNNFSSCLIAYVSKKCYTKNRLDIGGPRWIVVL